MQKYRLSIWIIALLLLTSTGCDSLIYEDLSECPQGVNFKFYSQTPCENSPKYPSQIKQVRVFAFDQNNVLVEEYSATGVTLSGDYQLETPFYKIGAFTFVAWGGEDLSAYKFSEFTKGVTTKQQMLVSLQKQANKVTTHPRPVYVGVTNEPLTIADRSKIGSIFDLVQFNMQELTNRVSFTIRGLSKTDNYSITITDDNSVYTITGDFAPDTRFDYITDMRREGDALKADFVLLKLAEKRNAVLTITNTTTGEVEYSVNLIEGLILYKAQSGEPPYKLQCDHDFNIDLFFETHMLVKAVVNNWNVVSRPIILQ